MVKTPHQTQPHWPHVGIRWAKCVRARPHQTHPKPRGVVWGVVAHRKFLCNHYWACCSSLNVLLCDSHFPCCVIPIFPCCVSPMWFHFFFKSSTLPMMKSLKKTKISGCGNMGMFSGKRGAYFRQSEGCLHQIWAAHTGPHWANALGALLAAYMGPIYHANVDMYDGTLHRLTVCCSFTCWRLGMF